MHLYQDAKMLALSAMGLNVRLEPEETATVLTRFIRDHVEDAGATGVVLGLSSGLDSALAAALAVRAIGPEKVQVVFLPSATTPDGDEADARKIAQHLGLELQVRPVDPVVEAAVGVVGERDRDTIGNATARARMIVLYALARKRQALVLGTSNKSELLVGYFTKYGDGGSDLIPLGDLYKTQVRILAEHVGLPAFVVEKKPSAGLWEGQTDEAELGMQYEELDRVLLGMELGMTREEISQRAGVDPQTVDRVDALRRASEHKRQSPRVCKIGIRSLTSDWRRSVTEGGAGV